MPHLVTNTSRQPSLVELQKIRTGSYPQKLSDLKFTGDWDALALDSVEYPRRQESCRLCF
jgi:hypothetical protein